MAVPYVSVAFWPVIVSALVAFVLGSLWYSPLLFGNIWMKAMGISTKKINAAAKKGMAKSYFIMFLGSVLMSYILAHFVQYVTANSFAEGATLGCWLWLGFFVPTMLGSVLWEGKPLRLYFINVSYYLAVLIINGGILAVWQ